MPRTVYVPELGRAFSFADGTSDEAVSAFFQKNFSAPPPSAAPSAQTPEASVGSDESGILERLAYGFGTGLTDVPGGIASLMYPAEEAAVTVGGKMSEDARKYLEETLGIDPTKDPTAIQQGAQALGTVGSFLIPGTAVAKGATLAGVATRNAGRLASLTASLQGAAVGAEQRSQTIRSQLASGMQISEEDQLAAQRLSGLIGLSEALPLDRFFGPIGTLLSKVPASKAPIVERIVKSRLANITKAGAAEGAQEVASGIANDLVEYGVYNPNVEIGQDLLSNAGTGAFAGSFVEGLVQLAAGRKLRPYRQLQEDLGREAAVNAQAQRQGEISRAAEELRKVNVEGDVEVVEDDFDGISRFTIRTPGGNTVGDFLDPAEAEEAVKIYKQRTDANVTIRKPADLPSVFPVKINGKEYQTTDEIVADRDNLVSQAEGLATYMSRPDVIKREAARQNVSEALVKKATDEEVADLNKKITKLNEFVAAAKPTPAVGLEEGDLRSRFTRPPEAVVTETPTPETVAPEAIAPEAPIGAVEPVYVEAPITEAPAIAEPVEPSVAPMEPEEPRTSAGQLKEAPVRRRTLAQAEAEGPILRDYNQATIDRYASIYSALKSRLSGKVPKNAEVKLEELISTDKNLLVRGQARIEKTPNGIKSIVDLSTGILRPDMTVEDAVKELVGTLNHEIIHVLRDQGVIRPAEWNILSKAATNTKVPGKKYTYLDKAQAIYTPYGQPVTPVYADPDAVIEEAVAEMYKDWVNNQNAPKQTRGLFNRITEFFRSIFRVLKSNKYQEVFQSIESGEVGAREGEGRVPTEAPTIESETPTEARLSAAPLPPYVEAKNRTLFVPERKESVVQSIFDFFRGPTTMPKTLNTMYGQIDMKGGYFGTRANLYRRMSLVDKNAYIEFLEKTANEKDTGNFQRREATQSAIVALGMADRSSQLTAASVIQGAPVIEYSRPGDIQSATVAVRNDADKLIDIFRVMLEPGPVDPVTGEPRDKRVVFKSYATAKRAIGLKAAGKPVPRELDDVYINTTIQSVQRDYPEIVEAYEKYQRFNKKLITAARDAGRITDAELAKFTQQMDYYGFYRELYEEQLVPGMPSKLAGDIKIREYKGSERGELIEDPMLVILTNVNFWMGAITRNIAANKAFKLAQDMGEARLLGASEKPDLSQGESEQVMFFRENGVQKRFAVKDPMLVTSLGANENSDMGGMMRLLGLSTSALRESVTRDPVFMVRNLLRDTLSSWITSGEDITPFIGTLKGFRDALNNSTSYQALVGRGVVGSHDLAMRSPAEMAAIIRRRALPSNVMNVASIDGMQSLTMAAWDKLGIWSEASDAATRIAVYESAIKQGMSEAEAAFRAIEIMNFSRRGSNSFLQALTQMIPFLNARIQGMDVLYQAGKAGVMTATGYQLGERDANLGKKFLYRGAMLAAISVALEAYFDLSDDEDYKEIPDYVKNGNLLIPLRLIGLDGYFAAIPKPFEAGLLFSTIPQEFYKATTGETSGREMANFFWSEFVSTFGLTPFPQLGVPIAEAYFNKDFYTGLPLISEGKLRLTPELQYDSRTSSLARLLSEFKINYNFTTGKFEGVSPIIIDQMITGYGGPMGTYMLDVVGLLMESSSYVGVDIAPERLPKDVTQLPGIRSFLLDAESKSPKSVAQAYELFRIVDEVNRSFSRLRQTGDVEATMDYLEENKDILSYKKYIYKLFDGLNKISARERQIERDETMTREQKFEAMKQLREVRARLTSNIAEINKALGR